MKAETGAVIWEGPSRFDGSPVAVVLTWQTANEKTGPMVQAWILRSDMAPTEAVRTGADRAICGECPRAGQHGCYVNIANAPLSVYRKLARGEYPRLDVHTAARRLSGQKLRIGAYGDPAAVPASIWWTLAVRGVDAHGRLIRNTAGHTGYTHSPHLAPALRELVMASCETEIDAVRWQAHGWRTYRILGLDEEGEHERLAEAERLCPASAEGGKRTACAYCLACDGSGSARSIAVVEHSGLQRSRLARLRRSRDGEALLS